MESSIQTTTHPSTLKAESFQKRIQGEANMNRDGKRQEKWNNVD